MTRVVLMIQGVVLDSVKDPPYLEKTTTDAKFPKSDRGDLKES